MIGAILVKFSQLINSHENYYNDCGRHMSDFKAKMHICDIYTELLSSQVEFDIVGGRQERSRNLCKGAASSPFFSFRVRPSE